MAASLRAALVAAIPQAEQRLPLAARIESVDHVAAMSTVELERMNVAHEAECVSLTGRLEAATDELWIRKARQALRVLHLHRGWIARELAKRKREASQEAHKRVVAMAAESRAAAQQRTADLQQAAAMARAQRIQAAAAETERHVAVFKEVAREVLGEEMYAHLWEMTRRRLEETTA